MAKIHDWNRVYWRNASGDREYFMGDDLEEGDVPEAVRCMYRNEHGDTVAYRLADEEAEHGQKYEVTLNGEVISGVEFTDAGADRWVDADEEDGRNAEVEIAAFSTRGDSREFAAAWRDEFGSPEDLGYVQYEEDELLELDYDEVVEIAQEQGIKSNQSHEELAAQISGEEEPDLTADAQAAPAE